MKKILFLFAVIIFTSGLIYAQDEFFDSPEPSAEPQAGPAFNLSGDISTGIKGYTDGSMDFISEASLKLSAESESFEGVVVMKALLDGESDESSYWGASEVYWEDLIDEAAVKYFFSGGFVEAGYTIVEWGKGDGMHAADPVNPVDQSRGFGGDADDLKAPVPLVRTAFFTGANSMLEFICVPLFVPVKLADQGRWLPYDIPDTVTVTDERPEMSFENLQGGARFTFTAGPSDLGFQVYRGFMQEPGFKFTTLTDLSLEYTGYILFAVEGAIAAGPFTFRAEAGYNMTEDTEGTDPALYNSRAVYLGGFDVTVPGTQLYFLAQVSGDYTFNTDGLTPDDVDVMTGYDYPAHLTNFAVSAEHPFFNDKMKIRLSGSYMLEAEGYFFSPEITYSLDDNLEFSLSGAFYGGADKDYSVLHEWEENDNVQMGLNCSF